MKILPEAALDQHMAILGKTGSGKTYAAKGVVEKLLTDKRQVFMFPQPAAESSPPHKYSVKRARLARAA